MIAATVLRIFNPRGRRLVADCYYPTPHAFRHMWAEAVYRRFDGDIGWMIRSQFKHITRYMWGDYIRDKENRVKVIPEKYIHG